MKLSEITKLGVINFDNPKFLQGRVFIDGKPTTCMQARVMLPRENGRGCGPANTLFQFGIDIYPESDMVLTVCEHKWDYTVLGLLKEMAKVGRIDAGYAVIICGDRIDERENPLLRNDKFLNGIEEIEFDI